MLLDLNCNMCCWECSRDCPVKDLFTLPEPLFNITILDSLKPIAGFLITRGIPKEKVDKDYKITAVTFSITRKEYLKKK